MQRYVNFFNPPKKLFAFLRPLYREVRFFGIADAKVTTFSAFANIFEYFFETIFSLTLYSTYTQPDNLRLIVYPVIRDRRVLYFLWTESTKETLAKCFALLSHSGHKVLCRSFGGDLFCGRDKVLHRNTRPSKKCHPQENRRTLYRDRVRMRKHPRKFFWFSLFTKRTVLSGYTKND